MCWQNFVTMIHSQHCEHYYSPKFVQVVNDHLCLWNLSFYRPGPSDYESVIRGTQEDMTAWMLSYS